MAEVHSGPSRSGGRGMGGTGASRGTSSGRGRGGAHARRAADQEQHGGVPTGSVSKLKAQLRQTKRLLAREDLNPDVRTTSERRLALLEDELAKAEQSNVEKKMVQRYRGVKFFERQKLLRKIKQAKKTLADVPESSEAQTALLDARVDLYYVLRYPKTEKYVALFPDGNYSPFVSPDSLDPHAPPAELKRQSLRASIRERIEKGKLPAEAELGELGIEGEEDVGAGPAKRKREEDEEGDEEQNEELSGATREQANKKAKKVATEAPAALSKKAPAAPAPAEDKDEAEQAQEAEGTVEPKKKENRKQRKERKRAEQAVGAGAGEVSASKVELPSQAAAMKEASWKSKTKAEQLVEQDDFFA